MEGKKAAHHFVPVSQAGRAMSRRCPGQPLPLSAFNRWGARSLGRKRDMLRLGLSSSLVLNERWASIILKSSMCVPGSDLAPPSPSPLGVGRGRWAMLEAPPALQPQIKCVCVCVCVCVGEEGGHLFLSASTKLMERVSVHQGPGHRPGGYLGLASVDGLRLPPQTLASQRPRSQDSHL